MGKNVNQLLQYQRYFSLLSVIACVLFAIALPGQLAYAQSAKTEDAPKANSTTNQPKLTVSLQTQGVDAFTDHDPENSYYSGNICHYPNLDFYLQVDGTQTAIREISKIVVKRKIGKKPWATFTWSSEDDFEEWPGLDDEQYPNDSVEGFNRFVVYSYYAGAKKSEAEYRLQIQDHDL